MTIEKPFAPFLLGAAALFWGWQTGNYLVGAALALVLELPRYLKLRLELDSTDYARVADFCAVLFAGIAVLLLVNRGAARGVLSSLQWFPVAILPLYLAQRFGEGLRTSAIFLYVRRRLRRDPSYPDPLVDLSGPYLATLVVAAGVPNLRGPGYFVGVVAITAWALFVLRPRSAPALAFAALLGASATLGYFGHIGLAHLQGEVEAWIEGFLLRLPDDPERTQTRIGSVGRLKQQQSVVLRLIAPGTDEARPKLLHLASFNDYRFGAWHAIEPGPWQPLEGPAARGAQIVLRTQGGAALLPLPADTTSVVGLPEGARRTGLGAVLADASRGWLRYEARYDSAGGWYAPPGPQDLAIPASEKEVLHRVSGELKLQKGAKQNVALLEKHFAGFKYTTWREQGPQSGMTGLGDFLLQSKSGHCEYYAAATTLLLRAAGIPARYATGYAAIEYSDLEGAWLVRARHAHAWTRAFIDGRWVDVDLTPASWPEDEAGLAPPWERLADLFRWAQFRWTTRGEGEASPLWWAAGFVLFAVLAWRLRNRRRKAEAALQQTSSPETPNGHDSEFYALEKALATRFRPREPHEALGSWFSEIRKALPEEQRGAYEAALALHQRYRFDPIGLSGEERDALRKAASA